MREKGGRGWSKETEQAVRESDARRVVFRDDERPP